MVWGPPRPSREDSQDSKVTQTGAGILPPPPLSCGGDLSQALVLLRAPPSSQKSGAWGTRGSPACSAAKRRANNQSAAGREPDSRQPACLFWKSPGPLH